MKKEQEFINRLGLEKLKVESFVTSLERQKEKTIIGGEDGTAKLSNGCQGHTEYCSEEFGGQAC